MKRPLAKWKWAVVAAATVTLLTVLFLAADGPELNPPGLTVTSLAFTNDPGRGRVALLTVSNESRRVVAYAPVRTDVWSNGAWAPGQYPASGWISFPLAPGAWTNSAIAVSASAGKGTICRVSVQWYRVPNNWDRLRLLLKKSVLALRKGRRLPVSQADDSLDFQESYSLEFVSPPEGQRLFPVLDRQ
jgi:hypothetical protein